MSYSLNMDGAMDAAPSGESMSYEIKYTDGRTSSHDSYEAAVAELASCGCTEIGHSGDLSDDGDSTLAWLTAEDADNDDGAKAHASIYAVRTQSGRGV